MEHDHCCVNFCSNDKRNKIGYNLYFFDFFSEWFIEIETDRRYKARWRAGFRGKSRVVIFISDRLFLMIEDSASSFLIYDYWTGLNLQKNWGRFSSACWSTNFFLLLRFVLSAVFTFLDPCKLRCFRRVSPFIVLYIFSGLRWAEHTRVKPFFIWKIRLKPQIITRINEGESHYYMIPNPNESKQQNITMCVWAKSKIKKTYYKKNIRFINWIQVYGHYRRRTPAIGFHFDLMSHHSYVIANVVSK